MNARSITAILLLGVVVGLGVANLARANRSADFDPIQMEALNSPSLPSYAGLPQ